MPACRGGGRQSGGSRAWARPWGGTPTGGNRHWGAGFHRPPPMMTPPTPGENRLVGRLAARGRLGARGARRPEAGGVAAGRPTGGIGRVDQARVTGAKRLLPLGCLRVSVRQRRGKRHIPYGIKGHAGVSESQPAPGAAVARLAAPYGPQQNLSYESERRLRRQSRDEGGVEAFFKPSLSPLAPSLALVREILAPESRRRRGRHRTLWPRQGPGAGLMRQRQRILLSLSGAPRQAGTQARRQAGRPPRNSGPSPTTHPR